MTKPIRSLGCRAAIVSILVSPVGIAAIGSMAGAQSASRVPMSATYICRPALPGEPVSATMMKTSTSLVCRPLAVEVRMQDGSMKTIGTVSVKANQGPDFSHALTPQQIDDAWASWMIKTFHIDHSG